MWPDAMPEYSGTAQEGFCFIGEGMTPRTSRLSNVGRTARFADEPQQQQGQVPNTLSDKPIIEAPRQDGYADSQGKITDNVLTSLQDTQLAKPSSKSAEKCCLEVYGVLFRSTWNLA